MISLKDWYEAWRRTKQDELKIQVKIGVDWLELAIAIGLVMWIYKELTT